MGVIFQDLAGENRKIHILRLISVLIKSLTFEQTPTHSAWISYVPHVAQTEYSTEDNAPSIINILQCSRTNKFTFVNPLSKRY